MSVGGDVGQLSHRWATVGLSTRVRERGDAVRKMSAQDAAFLYGETPNWHMHVNGLMIVDTADVEGGWTFERFREVLISRIPEVPQLRWRYVDVPFGIDRPSWVEDPDLDPDVHIRRVGAPGTRRSARVVGRGRADHLLQARSTPTALGGLVHRGARGRTGRDPPEDAPRHRRRGLRSGSRRGAVGPGADASAARGGVARGDRRGPRPQRRRALRSGARRVRGGHAVPTRPFRGPERPAGALRRAVPGVRHPPQPAAHGAAHGVQRRADPTAQPGRRACRARPGPRPQGRLRRETQRRRPGAVLGGAARLPPRGGRAPRRDTRGALPGVAATRSRARRRRQPRRLDVRQPRDRCRGPRGAPRRDPRLDPLGQGDAPRHSPRTRSWG